LAFVVLLQAPEYGIDICFIEMLVLLYGHLFAEFLGVACGEPSYRRAKDRSELAPRIIVVEDVVGWMFFVVAFAIAASYDVYAISFAIKQTVDVADVILRLWPVCLDSCWLRQRVDWYKITYSVLPTVVRMVSSKA